VLLERGMRRLRPLLVASVLLASCGGDEESAPPGPPALAEGEEETAPGPDVDLANPPAPPPGEEATEIPPESTPPDPMQPAPQCGKKITVISTVGVPGASKFQTNGCWNVIVTDGSAVKAYRKCSTSDFVVHNATGISYAYDDTNPQHSLTQEKTFLAKCASGATGDGWEFMAYRAGWRLLGAPRLKAYFAELYGSSMTDIDSLWYVNGVYKNNAVLAKHADVYPMINFGTPKTSNLHTKMGAEALKICKTVKDGGYFGIYNAAWREGMPAGDPRLVAFQNAMNACTKKL
jgi:hypothetical protein